MRYGSLGARAGTSCHNHVFQLEQTSGAAAAVAAVAAAEAAAAANDWMCPVGELFAADVIARHSSN